MVNISRGSLGLCGALVVGCGPAQTIEMTSESTAALMALDPPVSSEIEIGVPKLSLRESGDAQVAFGANEYLAVWSTSEYEPRVFGTRITTSGEVLDPAGFYIGSGRPADVTFANGQFVVVSTPHASKWPGELRVTRVLASGEVLDPGGIVIAAKKTDSYVRPTIATDGQDVMVAWSESSGGEGGKIYIARMAPDGTVLDPGGTVVVDSPSHLLTPGLAFGDDEYVLAWREKQNGLRAMRISKLGQVLDPGVLVLDASNPMLQDYLSDAFVTHDGTQFLIGTMFEYPNYNFVHIRRMAADGTVQAKATKVNIPFAYSWLTDLAFDGQSTLLVIDNGSSEATYQCRINAEGEVLEAPKKIITEGASAKLAGHANGAFIVWHEWDTREEYYSPKFAFGSRVDANGERLDSPLPMSVRAAPAAVSAAAFNGRDYVVAWENEEGSLISLVSRPGEVLQRLALPTSDTVLGGNLIAGGGSSELTWLMTDFPTPSTVRRISAAGELLDSKGIVLAPSIIGLPPMSLSFIGGADPEGALFVARGSSTSMDPAIIGRPFSVRISNDGTQSAPIIIDDEPCLPRSLGFDGEAYLLTCSAPWGDSPKPGDGTTLYGLRLAPDGKMLDSNRIPIVTVKDTSFDTLVATFDGTNHLFVWRTSTESAGTGVEIPFTARLHGIRVDKYAQVQSPEPFLLREVEACTDPMGNVLRPVAGSTGNKTFVVWSEPSNATSCHPDSLDVVGVEIDQAGVVSQPFFIADEPGAERSPVIAVQPEGRALVAYSRFDQNAPFGADQVRARFIGACSCADGSICVDGVCAVPLPPKKDPPVEGGCACRIGAGEKSKDFPYFLALGPVLWLMRRQLRRRQPVS